MLYPQFKTAGRPVARCIPGSNPVTNSYRKMTRPIWPIVENPHGLLDDRLERG